MVAEMMTPSVGTYGLGLAAYPTACGVFYGHGGAVNGTGSIALVSADGATGSSSRSTCRTARRRPGGGRRSDALHSQELRCGPPPDNAAQGWSRVHLAAPQPGHDLRRPGARSNRQPARDQMMWKSSIRVSVPES